MHSPLVRKLNVGEKMPSVAGGGELGKRYEVIVA
jgi:hypothetical protein